MIVYDITNRESFLDVTNHWLKSIQEHRRDQSYQILLVGNKRDKDERQVSTQEGRDLARELNCPFYEIRLVEVSYFKLKDADTFNSNVNSSKIHSEACLVIRAACALFLPDTFWSAQLDLVQRKKKKCIIM